MSSLESNNWLLLNWTGHHQLEHQMPQTHQLQQLLIKPIKQRFTLIRWSTCCPWIITCITLLGHPTVWPSTSLGHMELLSTQWLYKCKKLPRTRTHGLPLFLHFAFLMKLIALHAISLFFCSFYIQFPCASFILYVHFTLNFCTYGFNFLEILMLLIFFLNWPLYMTHKLEQPSCLNKGFFIPSHPIPSHSIPFHPIPFHVYWTVGSKSLWPPKL